ncbi:helix-turn-helix transcriptional regulator [Sphingomonas arantia]|uniref:Helix-turn-helix transcriptional regulator n=1 Tax=Sphingomonas arantia TaxID=1460676 RepID=A0ABW4TXA5_9SPHN
MEHAGREALAVRRQRRKPADLFRAAREADAATGGGNSVTREHDNIVRLPEVRRRTGLHRATIYRKVAAGTFPTQIAISTNCVGWYESDINEWVGSPR